MGASEPGWIGPDPPSWKAETNGTDAGGLVDSRRDAGSEGTLTVDALVAGLGRPSAYPHAVDRVEVHHTHVSVVFLAGDFAYKVKKPVDLGFLDFTTLDRRHHFCREEVRLNRRLAPDVYLGVVPVTRDAAEPTVEPGPDLVVDGAGPVVEYAVKMRRLPAHATLLERLRRDALTEEIVKRVADRIAAFHDDARGGEEVAAYGRWRVVARNALENLRQTRDHVGRTVSETVHQRARAVTEDALRSHRARIAERCHRGVPRDTHGDLHLDHVYLLPDRDPPDDLAIIDCVEFNRRFRYADPVADLAFLAMDLSYRGRRDLAEVLVERYFERRDDAAGRSLLPLYVSYRALVRAKVRGIAAAESSIPLQERRTAARDARGYWLLGVDALSEPGDRPGLILVGGLPGTGKSTLARGLARAGDFVVIASDRERKRLAGLPDEASAGSDFGEGIYTPVWTRRTYAACLRSAREHLCRGDRVIVDATFREDTWRSRFLEMGRALSVRRGFLIATCAPEVARSRLRGRGPDPSDADWRIHRKVAERWEPLSETVSERASVVHTGGSPEESIRRGQQVLEGMGLASPNSGKALGGATRGGGSHVEPGPGPGAR